MKYKPYPKYKDSGVEWIGKIPEDWEVHRSKFLLISEIGKKVGEGYENYIELGDIDKETKTYNLSDKLTVVGAKKVPKNTILISTVRPNLGGITITQELINVSSAFCTLKMNTKFDFYYLNNDLFFNYLFSRSTGSTYPTCKDEDILNYPYLKISEKEQNKIVDFLDSKTSQLSKTIAADKKLIELLKEKRTALINHVVTKGLNPKAKMRDSGIEWIGEVPEGWDIVPFKIAISTIVPMRDKPTSFDGDIPWIRIEDFDSKYISDSKSEQNVSKELVRNMNLKIYPVGTVLCSCSCNMGKVAIVKKPLTSNQTFIGMVPKKNILADYIYYLMQIASEYLNGIAIGAIQTYLSQDEVNALKICLPPKSEQLQISEYLNKATSKIDKTIQKIEQKIELLEEYKKSLIHHVVTGKVDVRDISVW